jgi:hypothetical protein
VKSATRKARDVQSLQLTHPIVVGRVIGRVEMHDNEKVFRDAWWVRDGENDYTNSHAHTYPRTRIPMPDTSLLHRVGAAWRKLSVE